MTLGVEELVTGHRVGQYTLLFRLGKGGMGEVWCASSGSSTGGMGDFLKLVALKLLRDAEEGSNSSVMFFDEAKVAAALQHASIVPTLDLGKAQNTYFLAMEMIRGPSLTALLQHLALKKMVTPPALVAYIGERIASALDYANARAEIQGKKLNLVHRDISPHNVLLDQSGNVVLSDFGVARTAVQDHLSRVGTVRGKPSYMAPEQVNGGDIDGRTDVFALGTVLYETACVKRLFGRGKPLQSMQAVLTHEPQPLTEKVPGFPKELADVIHKALQKKPEDRYQSASEMVQALAECSRKLPGASTVQRDLAELIAKLFPSGSFDVEGKAREAISSIGEMTHSGSEEFGNNGASVRPMALGEADQAVPTAMSGRYAAPTVWPSASHADPLAPEALDEVKQEQTRLGYFQQDGGGFTPMGVTGPGSVGSMEQDMPLPVAQPPARGPTWILMGVLGVAIVGLAAGAVLLSRGESGRNPALVQEVRPPPVETGPRAVGAVVDETPTAIADTTPPEPEPPPVERARSEPSSASKSRGSNTSRPTSKAPERTPSERTTPEPAPAPAPAPKREPKKTYAADRDGVLACIRALEAKGSTAVTRIKIGWGQAKDEKTFETLRNQCVAALSAD